MSEQIAFGGKTVLEIGPGEIRHLEYMDSKPDLYAPDMYAIVDINHEFLETDAYPLTTRLSIVCCRSTPWNTCTNSKAISRRLSGC